MLRLAFVYAESVFSEGGVSQSAAVDELVEAIKHAIEEALDEGRPRIATELLAVLSELEWRCAPPPQERDWP